MVRQKESSHANDQRKKKPVAIGRHLVDASSHSCRHSLGRLSCFFCESDQLEALFAAHDVGLGMVVVFEYLDALGGGRTLVVDSGISRA